MSLSTTRARFLSAVAAFTASTRSVTASPQTLIAGEIFTHVRIPAGNRAFWIESAPASDFERRGILGRLGAGRAGESIWVVQSARADKPFIIDGHYSGDVTVEVIDPLDGASLGRRIVRRPSVPVREAPHVTGQRLPPNQLVADGDAPLRDFRDITDVLAQAGAHQEQYGQKITLVALMPYVQYQAMIFPTSWLFTLAPMRAVYVVRRSYPHGLTYARAGSYYSAVTTNLTDGETGTSLSFGISGQHVPGTGGPLGRRGPPFL